MKTLAASITLALAAVCALTAQSPQPTLRAGLTVGLCWAAYREETYSTLLQRLDSTRIVLDLDVAGGALVHRLSAGFTMGRTRSAVSDVPTIARFYDEYTGEPIILADPSPVLALKAHLSYGLATPVVSATPYTGAAGGFLRLEALVQVANYPSITALISLGPLYRQTLVLGLEDRLSLDISAPLAAYAVRPPWAGVDAALMQTAARNPLALFLTGKLLSIGRHHGVYLDAAWTHEAAPWMDLLWAASASVVRTAHPRPRADAELSLRAGAYVGE